jgi:hypothetical protein
MNEKLKSVRSRIARSVETGTEHSMIGKDETEMPKASEQKLFSDYDVVKEGRGH